MTSAPGLASFRGSDAGSVTSTIPSTFAPTTTNRPVGRPAVRTPEQLRMHHALQELGWTGVDEPNNAAQLKNQSAPEPILVTSSGIILAGFGQWQLAVLEGRSEIHCIEYPLNDDESLQFILNHDQIRRGWSAFVRICLALTLEPSFQQKAIDNMRAGGKLKGWTSLPVAQHFEVRERIASAAGVCARNVSEVKTILEIAHPRLIAALRDGALTINGAMQFCKFPKAEQLEQFIRHSQDRETDKVIRRSITRPKEQQTSLDVATVLDALHQQEARQPGLVVVRVGRLQRTVILIGQDLLTRPHSQKELELHEIPRSALADSVSDTSILGPE